MDYDLAEFDPHRPDDISTEVWMNASNDKQRPDGVTVADWISQVGEGYFEADEDYGYDPKNEAPRQGKQIVFDLTDSGKVIRQYTVYAEDASIMMSSHSDDIVK